MNRKLMISLSVTAAFILTLGLFLSFFALLPGGDDGYPIVLPDTASRDNQTGLPNFSDEVLEGNVRPLEVTPENVLSVVSSLTRPAAYSCRFDIEYFWRGGGSSVSRRVWVKDGYSRIDSLDGSGMAEKTAVIGDGRIFMWPSGSISFYPGFAGGMTADNLLSIPSYEALLARDSSGISDAGYRLQNGRYYIYITYKDDEKGYEDTYLVALDTGLLISFERREDSFLSIRASMTGYDSGAPDGQIFTLPDGQYPWDFS